MCVFNPWWSELPGLGTFYISTLPTFSLFLSRGWLQLQLSSMVQGGKSSFQLRVVNCSLNRERRGRGIR